MRRPWRGLLPLAVLAVSLVVVGVVSSDGATGVVSPAPTMVEVVAPSPVVAVVSLRTSTAQPTPLARPAPTSVAPTVRPLVRASGHELRIDLEWDHPRTGTSRDSHGGYHVYRADQSNGTFERLTTAPLTLPLFSDFLAANDVQRFYRVTAVASDGSEIGVVGTSAAQSRAQDDQEFMTSVQRATFRYFWDFAHPDSGLVRERSGGNPNICATGGTGFGLFAIMIGVDRGFITRAQAVERINRILHFYDTKAERYHGAFAHWLDGRTGKTVPFSTFDDGGDIVETSFLVQGMLAVRQYFNRNDPQEIALRVTSTKLWESVEWSWYLRSPESHSLYWHWSPNYGWAMDLKVGGGFNETMITYLLAMSSPTYPIPDNCYDKGWVGEGTTYVNGSDYYGYTQWVGQTHGGPLFFTHYSFIGLDPRGLKDRYCDYFENNRNISLINRSYCIENPGQFPGYGELVWGLTASDGPDGYLAHAPGVDNGTIAPTASISAMPYIPAESLATMRHLYRTYGAKLWGPMGFKDAFNPGRDWFANDHLAIDQGPIICMIENHRTGLCWEQFMKNPEIHGVIAKIAAIPEVDAGKVVESATAP
jgi:exo beta-1,2-glucooligosaccharide sophorohydrolase (non-reducing end)